MAEELLQQIDQLDDPKLKIILQILAKFLEKRERRTGCYAREQSY